MENTSKSQLSERKVQNELLNSKKVWIKPSVTEIPKYAILGGPNSGKTEGGTLFGSI